MSKSLPNRTRVDIFTQAARRFEPGTVIATDGKGWVLIVLDRGGVVESEVGSPILKVCGDEK